MREFKSFLKTVGGNEGSKCKYSTRLDTYGCGCAHDCKYCYAKSLLFFRKLWRPNDPSVADIKKILRAVSKMETGSAVRLGGMTDCFQPIEKTERVTYETIKALNERRVNYLIVTKSAMIADDEYLKAMDKDLAHIQVTVTTLNDELAATYEKASAPSERVAAIKKLQSEGFDVALRLSPFIPQYVDFDKLNSLGIDKVVVEFLRVNTWVKKWFDIDYSEYTIYESGYNHLPLSKKVKYVDMLTGFKELTVCEDESCAYNFWRNNKNHNPQDCCNLRIRYKG